MGLISKYHTFVDGQGVPNAQITAIRLNTNWDRLYTLVNGNIDQANVYSGYNLTRSGALPTFSAGSHEGILWYDTGANKMYYGDNTEWKEGVGVDGATGPAGTAGAAGPGSAYRVYTWVIAYPTTGTIAGPQAYEAQTIKRVSAATSGGTSVALNIEKRADATPGVAGTDAMPSELTADSDNQKYTFSGASGESAAVAADEWIFVHISAVTGVVTQLVISVATEIS